MPTSALDVTDVPEVRRLGGEVPLQGVGQHLVRRLGDGGPDPAFALVAADVVLAHHPGDPLAVDPLGGRKPSLSSAVARGAPMVLSSAWIARILSASSASAAALAARVGAA